MHWMPQYTTVTPLVQFAAADVPDPGQNVHNVQTPNAEVVQKHPIDLGQSPPERVFNRSPEMMHQVHLAKAVHQSPSEIRAPASEAGALNAIATDRSCAAVKPMHPIPCTNTTPIIYKNDHTKACITTKSSQRAKR